MLFSFVGIALSPRPFRLLIFELVLRRIICRFLWIFWLGIPLSLVASWVFSRLICARGESIVVMLQIVLVDPILIVPRGVLYLPRLMLLCLSLRLINHFE